MGRCTWTLPRPVATPVVEAKQVTGGAQEEDEGGEQHGGGGLNAVRDDRRRGER
jgi:hypothetical protein